MSKWHRPPTLKRAVRVTVQNYGVATFLALVMSIFLIPWWIQWSLLYLGGVVFLASVIALYVENWRPKSRVKAQGKAVFISGCDTGFGYLFAQRLDRRGLQVFAGCLFPENEGAQTLKNSCSERLHIVPLDVTSDESVQNAVKYVTDNLGSNKLWAVVNNAGVGGGSEMAWTSMNSVKRILEVNTIGVVRTTKAFIPLLCNGKGRVITIASAAGRYTYPGMVSYCMSKYAIISFSEGLRIETYRLGLKVITIEPHMYRSNMTDTNKVLDYTSKTWERVPDEIKKLYPEDYLKKIKESRKFFFRNSVSRRPEEVVDCLEEAILAFDPKYVYSPGTLYSRFVNWVLKKLPKPIADRLIHDKYDVLSK